MDLHTGEFLGKERSLLMVFRDREVGPTEP